MSAPQDTLNEQLRASHERVLTMQLTLNCERKQHRIRLLELEQALTSLRWFAVVFLFWVTKEVTEPARFILDYPSSWAFKLSVLGGYPSSTALWFAVSGALIAPLVVLLATAPRSKACLRAQDVALVGLGAGGLGFVYMASLAMRVDAPQIVDAYVSSTILLASTGLLVACWHNTRIIRAYREKALEDNPCAAPAL